MKHTKRILLLCLVVSTALGFFQILNPVAAMEMDRYEPNDSFTEAYDLNELLYNHDAFGAIAASQEDADYYKIIDDTELAFGSRLELGLEYNPVQNDLWLEVYDENYTLVLTLDQPDDQEHGSLRMQFNVTYYILVQGENTGFPYNLRFGIFTIESIEDEFENSNDNQHGYGYSVTELGEELIQPNTTYSNLTLSGGEEDWYGFEANAGDIVNISVETNATTGYDVYFTFDAGESSNYWLGDQWGSFSFQKVLYFDKSLRENENGYWRGDLYYFSFERWGNVENPLVTYNFTLTLTSPGHGSAHNSWCGLELG